MSKDLNLCQFIGRLGKDPEARAMQDGTAVSNFSIAVGWKTKAKEGTEWVRVSAFGKLAEICNEYLTKGKQVYIAGAMSTRQYEKDGQTHYMTEIRAEQMQMLGGGEQQAPQQRPQQRQASADEYRNKAQRQAPAPSFDDLDGDDIPW